MKKHLFIYLFILSSAVFCQTVKGPSTFDTATVQSPVKHSPKLATIFSAVVPGAGQVYNKKYWKVPIIYAGLGTLGYFFQNNNSQFQTYKRDYIALADTVASTVYTGQFTKEQLLVYQETFRRNRDLTAIGILAFYILNVVDANVDAHLFTFDVSDNLTLNLQPTQFNFMSASNRPLGLKLSMRF